MSGALKIDRVRIYPFDIPLVKPFKIATMTNHAARGVFVAIDAGGLTGWGECLPFHAINGENQGTCVESLKVFTESLIGKNALELRRLIKTCFQLMPTQTTAICGVDVALHDLVSQSANLPLWAWLGGSQRELKTDLTIGIVEPQEAKSRAAEIASQGFEVIKLKLGDGLVNDYARVEAVREGAPDVDIRVDANQAYDRESAMTVLEGIAEFDIQFCEQPVKRGDWEGLKWLHNNAPVPVMADESCFSAEDAFGLFGRGCCSLVNVKLCKSGGILGGGAIGSVVEAGFGKSMIGGMAETRLGVTASAHLACTNQVFEFFDLDAHMGHTFDPIDGGIQIVSGAIKVGNEVGLGARPTGEFLNQLDCLEVK